MASNSVRRADATREDTRALASLRTHVRGPKRFTRPQRWYLQWKYSLCFLTDSSGAVGSASSLCGNSCFSTVEGSTPSWCNIFAIFAERRPFFARWCLFFPSNDGGATSCSASTQEAKSCSAANPGRHLAGLQAVHLRLLAGRLQGRPIVPA